MKTNSRTIRTTRPASRAVWIAIHAAFLATFPALDVFAADATGTSSSTASKHRADVSPGAPPKQLAVGASGWLKPGLLLQGWLFGERDDATRTTIRLRRAEIIAKGDIVPGLASYKLMIDPAKVLEWKEATVTVKNQDPAPTDPETPETIAVKQPPSGGAISMLQDFFITFATEWVDVSLGQFKIPVSLEGNQPSSALLFPERAVVAREFGDRRDLGVRFAKSFEWVGFVAGIFNGAGQNNLDGDNAKDLSLRLEFFAVKGLTVAGVVYGTIGDRSQNARDRYEADVRFASGPFVAQAEYIRARDVAKAGAPTSGHGFYGMLAWTFFDVLEPCVRVGYLDPNVDANVAPKDAKDKDEVLTLEAGVNYYFAKNDLKLQLAYGRFEFDDKTASNQAILAAQAGF